MATTTLAARTLTSFRRASKASPMLPPPPDIASTDIDDTLATDPDPSCSSFLRSVAYRAGEKGGKKEGREGPEGGGWREGGERECCIMQGANVTKGRGGKEREKERGKGVWRVGVLVVGLPCNHWPRTLSRRSTVLAPEGEGGV